MSSTISNISSNSLEGLSPKEANRKLRIQLAAAHRGLVEFKINDRVFNHLSALAPAANGDGEVMLITPFPKHFAEITPSCLLGINSKGEVVEGQGSLHNISGSFHRGFYMERPNLRCMFHTHSPYVSSLACLEDPTMKIINQTSTQLYKELAYDLDYGGIVDDIEEGKRIGRVLGPDKKAMLLAHHGSVTAGATVSEAFNLMFAMEFTAKIQLKAMQTNQKIVEIRPEVLEKTFNQIQTIRGTPIFDAHLASVIKKLGEENPEFVY